MRALLVLLAGCSYIYEGQYTAEVTLELHNTITESVELVEIVEGDLGTNERRLRRENCELVMFQRGGYGLRFVPGKTCERDGESWTLIEGSAPNDDSDVLVIDLVWDRPAKETLRIER